MTLTPSQRASLASALQIMFDGVDTDDIVHCLKDALDKRKFRDLHWAMEVHMPIMHMATITRDWFDERIDGEFSFDGNDADFKRLLSLWASHYDSDYPSHIMNDFERFMHDYIERVPEEVTEVSK